MRVWGRLGALLVAGGVAAGVAVVGAAPAEASSFGCTGFGPGVTYKGVYVTNGTFCGTVNGSGRYVNYVGGNAYNHIPGQSFCNWEIKADFYDTSGAWRDWASTGIRGGCTMIPDLNIGVHRWERQGKVRITLRSNASNVASVDEAIF